MSRHDTHKVMYRALSALTLLLLAAVAVIASASGHEDKVLPVQFRLFQTRLSELPVRIDEVQSCSCWRGPRDQAQRKYKFRIENESDGLIDIGGGPRSAIRLLVAYPGPKAPRLTMPVPGDDDPSVSFESPPDTPVRLAQRSSPIAPSNMVNDNRLLGVPDGYSVWALPPAPNKLAEELSVGSSAGDIVGTFPTVVDRTHLLPGESYAGDRIGHGTWTFYIPLPHRLAESLSDAPYDLILERETYERHVIFIGIAVFEVTGQSDVDIIGFAPAPSDDALLDPGDM
jgi:hypothetical protein